MSRNAQHALLWVQLTSGLICAWNTAPSSAPAAEPALPSLLHPVESRSRMVIVENLQATKLFRPQADQVELMVRCGLTNLTGQASIQGAWLSLVSTQETIGIKVFTNPGPSVGTRLPVVSAVVASLLEAGYPKHQIIVWDKHLADLKEAGYLALTEQHGIRVEGALEGGFDETVYYENPLLGQLVFGDYEFGKEDEKVGRKSFVSRLITKEMTKLILISPLLNHNRAGVCGNLYSLAMGSVDNSLRFEPSPQRLAQAVPEIFALPELGDRVVLNIVDALICQYQGQERGLLHYSAVLNQVRMGVDPVALDVLSLQELKRQREQAQITGGFLNQELYDNAALLRIGISDISRIYVEHITLPSL